MGLSTVLNMRIQTESGEAIEPDEFVPIADIPNDPRKYPFLSSIDPYEDTVFNPSQCARLVGEWDLAASHPEWQKQTQEWRIVRDAAAKCASEHLYLKFIGD